MSTRRTLLLASGQSIDLSEYLLKSEAETLYAPLDAIVNKQDKLVSGTNIKTINGYSLLGSGDIVIEGGSSSGSSAYSEVSHGTADTTLTLTPNTFHIWDEVGSLTLRLGTETSGVANEYLFQFTSGSTATTLSLPDDIKWTGGETPTIEANKIYQVSILKGLGSVLEWDSGSAIGTFTINWGVSSTDFNFDNGMTWQDFVDSEYNTDSVIKISGSQVFYTNAYLIQNVGPTDAIINKNIYSAFYYD